MHKLLNAFHHKGVGSDHQDNAILPDSGSFPDDGDLYKYRKQRGVNLGM